jgi:hypothetical protein
MKLDMLIVNNVIKNIFKKEEIAKPKISESVVKHELLMEAIVRCPENSNIDNILNYCMAHDRKFYTKWGNALTTGNPFINLYLSDKDTNNFKIEDIEEAAEIFFESGNISDKRHAQLLELNELINHL